MPDYSFEQLLIVNQFGGTGWCNLVCSPQAQTITAGGTAAFSATGGYSSFSWSAPQGVPDTGPDSSTFRTSYSTAGTYIVEVDRGTKATCNVTVVAIPPVCPVGGEVILLKPVGQNITTDGVRAVATFMIASGCSGVQLTMGSYAKVSPGGEFLPQHLLQEVHGTFAAGGPYLMEVTELASCAAQVDLYKGRIQLEDLDEHNIEFFTSVNLDYLYTDICSQSRVQRRKHP
jgi:hypothetical protein